MGRVVSLTGLTVFCATLCCAVVSPASAKPLLEFYRDGITIVAEAPTIITEATRLTKIETVSAKTSVERVLIPGVINARKTLSLSLSLISGVNAFDNTASAQFAEADKMLPEPTLNASRLLTISIRPPSGRFGLMLRFSASGMLYLSADWADHRARSNGIASSLLPVTTAEPPSPPPDAVPLPASAPLLGGATAFLWGLAAARRRKRFISKDRTM